MFPKKCAVFGLWGLDVYIVATARPNSRLCRKLIRIDEGVDLFLLVLVAIEFLFVHSNRRKLEMCAAVCRNYYVHKNC